MAMMSFPDIARDDGGPSATRLLRIMPVEGRKQKSELVTKQDGPDERHFNPDTGTRTGL